MVTRKGPEIAIVQMYKKLGIFRHADYLPHLHAAGVDELIVTVDREFFGIYPDSVDPENYVCATVRREYV